MRNLQKQGVKCMPSSKPRIGARQSLYKSSVGYQAVQLNAKYILLFKNTTFFGGLETGPPVTEICKTS
jgi:hypothetical protein